MSEDDFTPDVRYTDRAAINDGVIVDVLSLGVRVHYNAQPVTRMSTTLFDALAHYSRGGSVDEQSAAYQAMLGLILGGGTRDLAEDDEPPMGWFTTDHQPALGEVTAKFGPSPMTTAGRSCSPKTVNPQHARRPPLPVIGAGAALCASNKTRRGGRTGETDPLVSAD